ncbi:MAG: L,D-transpeptidase [Actinomycetota bacterium]|nr:L,D-transpeptidase [Actinomycetota bacterium]
MRDEAARITVVPTTGPPSTTTTTELVDPSHVVRLLGDVVDHGVTTLASVTTGTTMTLVEPTPPLAAGETVEVGIGPAAVAAVSGADIAVYEQPWAEPTPDQVVRTFTATTRFSSPQVFLVTATHGAWLRVQLPIRPNHTEGWILRDQVELRSIDHRIVVDVSDRTITVVDGQQVVAQSSVVVGRQGTPTPYGRFFVTDALALPNPHGVYGPYILALSARSEALQSFNGDEPIIAIHGTNRPGLIGTAASNGCVRLPNELITQLITTVPLGTPVDVIA